MKPELVRHSNHTPAGKDWDPAEEVEVLRSLDLLAEEESEEFTYDHMARQILMRAAPLAAHRVAHIALNSQDDRVALAAAKEILTRVLGSPVSPMGQVASPLEDILLEVTRYADEAS